MRAPSQVVRDLPALRRGRILDNDMYVEGTTPGDPTRDLMEELKRAGITVWLHWVSHSDQPPAFK